MTTTTTTQVHRIWIKATPERIWAAITDPEWNGRYGYAAVAHYELRAGGTFRQFANDGMKAFAQQHGFEMPEVIADGEVVEADPPRRLKQTWKLLMDPATAAEAYSTLTYEISESKSQPGTCKLTVIHELPESPASFAMVAGTDEEGAGGGWAWLLSDLKSLVETGKAFNE